MRYAFRRTMICWAAAALAAAATPVLARAQIEVDLIPYFATYYALGDLGTFTVDGQVFDVGQGSTPMVGARLRVRVSNAFSVEASAAFGNSPVTALTDDQNLGINGVAFAGNILFASGRVIMRPPRSNLYLFGGAGIVQRGGDAWKENFDFPDAQLTSIAGVLGAGVRASVTPRWAIDVALEVNLYSADPDGEGTDFDSTFQQDFLISIGVPIPLLGR